MTPTVTPTITPTVTPAVTPTPTPSNPASEEDENQQASDGESAFDVAAGMDIIQVMQQVSADSEKQADQKLWIKDIDQVLTPDELARLYALPLEEQLFISLAVTGYEHTVRDALAEAVIQLSDEAQALMNEIFARADVLPVKDDGDEATVILVIRKGNAQREEKYFFNRMDGRFILKFILAQ